MPGRRSAFTQLDVQRAVRGARAAGLDACEIRIAPNGEIRVLSGAVRSGDTPRDVLDELQRHFGHA